MTNPNVKSSVSGSDAATDWDAVLFSQHPEETKPRNTIRMI